MRFLILLSFFISSLGFSLTDTCFSPESNCSDKLVAFITTAQKNLDIAIYTLTDKEIYTAISVASKRGVAVRIIADKQQALTKYSLISSLKQQGIAVRYGNQTGIMHNKFTIVDGLKLETGSFNYTAAANRKNNENQLYLDIPDVVQKYQARFNTIWQTADLKEK